MKKLKPILQSTKFYIIASFLIIVYVLIITKVVEYKSKLNDETQIIGIIKFYKIDGDKLTIELNSIEKVIVYYYFENENEKNSFSNIYGINDKISIYGSLSTPKNNTIPNTFNYKKYLKNNKINFIFNATKINLIEDNICFKDVIIKKLNAYKNKNYMYTFILGDKSYLDTKIYQNNGVSHLLAISGMHVSFIISLLESKLKIKNKHIINALLFLYAYIVSFSVGVLRVLIFRMLKTLNLEISNLNLLLLTAFILLIYNPFYIYNYGFLYSFLISGSIIYFNFKGNYIMKLLKISTISYLISIPITISINYELNLMTIINNLINVPLVTFIVFPLSLITLILPKLEFIFNLSIKLLEYINNNNYSINIIIPKLSLFFTTIYYSLFFIYSKSKNKLIILFIIILIICHKYKYLIENRMEVYYLDVGQGDSELLIFPKHQKVIMIDTGGKVSYEKESWAKRVKNYTISDNIILFLKSKSIDKIDYLVVTHGDNDHMGESINIVNSYNVKNVVLNCGEYNDLEKKLINKIEKQNINYYSCLKSIDIKKYKLKFLNTRTYDNENDNSSVIYLNYNNFKFLFMGDASTNRENDILNYYKLSKIDFFKVGHHGSNTSSSQKFIDSINPKYSIISVGLNNRYGHPKNSVLDTLINSEIFRTDEDGSIEIEIKKDNYIIKNYAP